MGKPNFSFHLREDIERGLDAKPALSLERRAVRLVERGLVNDADAEPLRDVADRARHLQGVRAALQCAGAYNEGELARIAEGDGAGPAPMVTSGLAAILVMDDTFQLKRLANGASVSRQPPPGNRRRGTFPKGRATQLTQSEISLIFYRKDRKCRSASRRTLDRALLSAESGRVRGQMLDCRPVFGALLAGANALIALRRNRFAQRSAR